MELQSINSLLGWAYLIWAGSVLGLYWAGLGCAGLGFTGLEVGCAGLCFRLSVHQAEHYNPGTLQNRGTERFGMIYV